MLGRLLFVLLTYPLAGSMLLTDKTLVTVSVNESKVYVGTNTMISISVEVAKGYHIQANKANEESLVPTTLELNELKGITINRLEFPQGKKFKLEGTDTFLSVYDGKFQIKLFISSGAELPMGNYILGAKLHYQACDSITCLFPRTIDFSIPIYVYGRKKVGFLSESVSKKTNTVLTGLNIDSSVFYTVDKIGPYIKR